MALEQTKPLLENIVAELATKCPEDQWTIEPVTYKLAGPDEYGRQIGYRVVQTKKKKDFFGKEKEVAWQVFDVVTNGKKVVTGGCGALPIRARTSKYWPELKAKMHEMRKAYAVS